MNTNHRLVSIFDGDAATFDLLLRHYAATLGPVIVNTFQRWLEVQEILKE